MVAYQSLRIWSAKTLNLFLLVVQLNRFDFVLEVFYFFDQLRKILLLSQCCLVDRRVSLLVTCFVCNSLHC